MRNTKEHINISAIVPKTSITQAIAKVLELKNNKELLDNITNTFNNKSEESGITIKKQKVKCKAPSEK